MHIAMGMIYNQGTGQSHYETIFGPTEDATAMLKGLCGCYMRLPMYIGPEHDFRSVASDFSASDGCGPATSKFDEAFLQNHSRQLQDFEFYKNQLKLLQAVSQLKSNSKNSGREKAESMRWCLKVSDM